MGPEVGRSLVGQQIMSRAFSILS